MLHTLPQSAARPDISLRGLITHPGRPAPDPAGLNGFILLLHIGTVPERTDKFYQRLDDLIVWLRANKYKTVRIDRLLKTTSP